MDLPVSFRPPIVARPRRLKGYSGTPGSGGIPHGTEVVLASVDLLKNAFPVLESLYYDGDQAGTRYLHFRVTLDGYPIDEDWSDSYNKLGDNGKPEPIGKNLPPGRLLEVRCKNEHPSDDTLEAFCDGEVRYYEKPLY